MLLRQLLLPQKLELKEGAVALDLVCISIADVIINSTICVTPNEPKVERKAEKGAKNDSYGMWLK